MVDCFSPFLVWIEHNRINSCNSIIFCQILSKLLNNKKCTKSQSIGIVKCYISNWPVIRMLFDLYFRVEKKIRCTSLFCKQKVFILKMEDDGMIYRFLNNNEGRGGCAFVCKIMGEFINIFFSNAIKSSTARRVFSKIFLSKNFFIKNNVV